MLLSQIRENEIRELSGDYDETAVVVASDLRTDDGGEIADGRVVVVKEREEDR